MRCAAFGLRQGFPIIPKYAFIFKTRFPDMPRKAPRKTRKVKSARKSPHKKTRKTVKRVEPIPKGYHTITPSIIVHDGAAAINFYVKGFGAKERERDIGPGGRIWHAALQVGDSLFMLMDEFPEMGANSAKRIGDSPGSIWLYVKDADKLYQQAIAAGAKSVTPPTDRFWGDRSAMVEDPFGHTWSIATRKLKLGPREIEKRRLAAMQEATQRSAHEAASSAPADSPTPSVTDFLPPDNA